MKVEVALYATLSRYLPPGSAQRKAAIAVRDGATAREIMLQLGIPQEYPNIRDLSPARRRPAVTGATDRRLG